MVLTQEVIQKFWEMVDVRGPDECWLWKGSTGGRVGLTGHRYGTVSLQKNELAHRVAYTIANGPIPKGARIGHTCGENLCCNRAHLVRLKQATPNIKPTRHGPMPRQAQSIKVTAVNELERERLRRKHAIGATPMELAREYNIPVSSIQKMLEK